MIAGDLYHARGLKVGVGATVGCVTILDGGITGWPTVEGAGEGRADSMRQVRK